MTFDCMTEGEGGGNGRIIFWMAKDTNAQRT